jgi:voltage-gated potassium channel
MSNTTWKNGRKFSFLVRDRHGNNINLRLECQLDKGNKRFVLRWQDPSDLEPETGKKKSKTKSCKSYEEAFQRVKDFEFKEDQRNSGAKQRLTFLSDDQLRDAEMALSTLPNGLNLEEVVDQFVQDLPSKEATINETYDVWMSEGKRAGKRKSSISSRKDLTRDFRAAHGNKMVHKDSIKDMEEVVIKKLQNGKVPSDRTIINRWSCIRSLELFIALIVIVSVIAYILEVEFAGSEHSLEGHPIWLWIERIVAIILTGEYFLRWKYEGRRYPRSLLGGIDLIAILPFWIGFITPISWLGLVRSMRILRLLKLYRQSQAMRIFVQALLGSRQYLSGMLLIVFIFVLFSAVGIREIERDVQPEKFGTLFDSIWWTIVTLMSVGYGDAVPISKVGKFFAQFVMVAGVGLTAAFIGIVGSNVYAQVQKLDQRDKEERAKRNRED